MADRLDCDVAGLSPGRGPRSGQVGQALVEMLSYMAEKGLPEMRDDCEFRIAVGLPPGTDPAPCAQAGATWWLPEFDPTTVSLDQVRGVLRDGPATL
jgi:hypothetical protein